MSMWIKCYDCEMGRLYGKDVTWQWINFLSQQMPDRMIPARRSLVESSAYEQKIGREIADVIRVTLEDLVLPSPGVMSEFGGALEIFGRVVTRVVNGQAVPLETMTQTQKEAEAKRAP